MMETVETNKFNKEDEQLGVAHKKRMDARAYRALFRKKRQKNNAPYHSDDLDKSDNERRKDDLLGKNSEKTLGRIEVTSKSQSEKEALENDDKHKLVPTSLNDSCKGMSSNGHGPLVSKGGLVAREINNDADKAKQDLQNSELDRGKLDAGVGGGHFEKSGNDIQKHMSSTDLLSLVDSQSNSNGNDSSGMNSSDNIGILKERLGKQIAYKCKLESSRFVEYWIPVNLSNVQVEQYCFSLLSNSLSLCSPSKTDPVGAVHNVLISSRKCCDHPYIVDQSLQPLLTKGLKEVEFLDVDIKASAKLQLLDQMLLEIKKRELKVLILFQSIGGRDLMGDILDEYLHQRFGPDSYERVGGGLVPSKKQNALNRFNNEKERFVFLIEIRACLPSIKLSAVGTVIIFGSDWSPLNDIRALHKMTLDSQFEQIKVFRLYSSFTVEERALVLSKQDKTLDSDTQNISPSNCHMLLMWGASILFQQLDNIHDISTSETSNLSEKYHLKDVIQEFFIILDQIAVEYDSKLSLILQAKQNRGLYRTEMPLFGEQQIKVTNEDSPHIFWTKLTKLLTGKSPQWKYSSCSSQRNRKRIQYFDDLQKSEAENAEVVKRRKKVVNGCNEFSSPKAGLHEGKMAAMYREGNQQGSSACGLPCSLGIPIASDSDKIPATSNSLHPPNNSKLPTVSMAEWESRRKQLDSQKNLLVLLKPQIATLCEVLHLPEGVKKMVQRFFEYVMNNHLGVYRDTATMLQAFQISLCWSAASLLKHNIDRKESLALARQHLGFNCQKTEAYEVNSKLQCLKGMFQYCTGQLNVPKSPKTSEEGSDLPAYSEESREATEFKLAQSDLQQSISDVEEKYNKKMTKLLEKQREKTKQLHQKYDEELAQLENKRKTEAAIIRLHSNVSKMADKLKKLESEYRSKFYELKRQRDVELDNREAPWETARKNVLERKTHCIEVIKSWALTEFVKPLVSEVNLSDGKSPITGPQKIVSLEVPTGEEIPGESTFSKTNGEVAIGATESANVCEGQDKLDSLRVLSSEKFSEGSLRKVDGEASALIEFVKPLVSEVNLSDGRSPITGPQKIVSLEAPTGEEIPGESTFSKTNGEVAIGATESVNVCEGQNNLASLWVFSSEKFSEDSLRKVDGEASLRKFSTEISGKGQENVVSLEEPSSVEVPDGSNLSKVDGQASLVEPIITHSDEGGDNVISAGGPLVEDIPNGATLSLAAEEYPLATPNAVGSSEAQQNGISANASPEKQMTFEATFSLHDDEVPTSKPEIETPSHGMDILVSSFEKEIPDVTAMPMPAVQVVSLAVPETSPSEDQEGGNIRKENDVTNASEIDQQDGLVCNMNHESEFREPSLVDASLVQPVATLDQGISLPQDQVAETLLSAAASVRYNEANADSPIVDLRVQMQLLRSLAAVNQAPQAPRQPVPIHIELSSQDILQPPLPPTDGATGGPVIHGSETGTASVPSFSGHPVQTAPAVSSQVPLPQYSDPLQNEMERIRNEIVQTINIHDTMKKQLKEECEREIEEIRKKYELKVQEKEAAFLFHKKELDQNYDKVRLNKVLAEAFRSKYVINGASGAVGAQPETSSSFMEQLVQLSPQQPSTVPGLTYGQLLSGSLVSAQTMGPTPPLQVVNPAPFIPRPPHINSVSPSAANLVIGTEIRAPAPHLQPFRPSSISPTPLVPNQHAQAQSYHHFASPSLLQPYTNSLSHGQAQASTSCQSGSMILPETVGMLAHQLNSSLPSDVLLGLSSANTNPPSNSLAAPPIPVESNMPIVQPNPARQSEPSDVVCLSDDD